MVYVEESSEQDVSHVQYFILKLPKLSVRLSFDLSSIYIRFWLGENVKAKQATKYTVDVSGLSIVMFVSV